ncbi:glycosyltransferase family 4 protein [Agrobacterium sp. rho-13.3]|uniref:glycosyltransferase family 4 protein n=1 Tax=Agrobacterium sp. rho-13.3 TaxID=3072980 RepID=UPI002A1325B7|nr:glycosyltransferase family 4 protein [Agrobacterium sp. rho-13.3]MDX8311746.1 glycosyltransferase family 4 protein [Agrobacterium sp. rho-13.3]
MNVLSQSIRQSISSKKTIIVSDRYLPKSFGGAEVSLHNALVAADDEFRSDALVVFFDSEITEPHLYNISKVSVLAVPDSAAWPFNSLPRARHAQLLKRKIYRHFWKYALPVKSIFQFNHFLTRLGAYYLELGPKPRGGVQSDFLLGDSDFRVKCLREVVEVTKCKLLVADNTRSIMAVGNVKMPLERTIAIIRDHRFNCARHNQIMMVNGNHCQRCDYSCAIADSKKVGLAEKIHRQHLERVQEKRKNVLSSFGEVVVTSHLLARNVRRLLGSDSIVTRVPNPAGSYNEVMSFCRGIAEEPHNDILVIGMLNEAKGQLELVNRAVGWLENRKDVRFIFAGRGERIKKSIQGIVEKKGLKANFVFKDYVSREDLFKLIRSCKVVLLPTQWKEPFGRVPLEAGLARKAVVSFAVGGICETVIDGHTGILVEPGNFEALLVACDNLLGDGALRMRLGEEAFNHVVANYLDDQTSNRLIDVIRGTGMADT